MRYIDHHAHMVSRTTDDYQQMALTGCVAVTEPAFWAGWDRSCGDSVEDYFRAGPGVRPPAAYQRLSVVIVHRPADQQLIFSPVILRGYARGDEECALRVAPGDHGA